MSTMSSGSAHARQRLTALSWSFFGHFDIMNSHHGNYVPKNKKLHKYDQHFHRNAVHKCTEKNRTLKIFYTPIMARNKCDWPYFYPPSELGPDTSCVAFTESDTGEERSWIGTAHSSAQFEFGRVGIEVEVESATEWLVTLPSTPTLPACGTFEDKCASDGIYCTPGVCWTESMEAP
jgi:hypothetical protein